MNKAIENMKERRSVKAYLDTPITEEELDIILEAGLYAPNGRGLQSPVFAAVTDKSTRDEIARLNAKVMNSDKDPFYGAPVVIVVFAPHDRGTAVEDGCACMCNMVNAAHSIGIDSCWIHRAKEVFETEEGKSLMKKWGVDDKYFGVGNVILGHRKGDYPAAKPRREGRIIKVK